MVRAAALLALLANLVVYDVAAPRLPAVSLWWGVAILALAVIPATFALVWLALPARTSRWLPAAALVAVALSVTFELVDRELAANYAKLAAATAVAWLFLRFFEDVSWIVLVAILIIPVDVISVARGPTKTIIEDHESVFDALSIGFPVPGEATAAQLGLPDVLFFALFLGAAARFGLRTGATWVLCTASFGLTLVLAIETDASGLPALPLLSAAFILANADLLWQRVRARLAGRARKRPENGPPAAPS